MKELFRLEDKKILITGASAGIGRSIASNCAKVGAKVSVTARNKVRLHETLKLMQQNDDHSMHIADLGDEEDIISLAKDLPELDGIVLNAGIVKTVPVKFIKKDTLEDIFKANIYGSILLVKHLLKLKKVKNNCSICFISSVASNKMTLGNSLYSATKGAVNSFTRSLALELASKQIRVNAILPGMVETDILKDSAISQENLNSHLKNYPIGRFGKPEDIAYLAIYMLSDASAFMTGSLVTIDGGYSIK